MEEVGDLGREGGGQRRSVAGEENLEGETFSCLIQIIFSLSLPALSLCLPREERAMSQEEGRSASTYLQHLDKQNNPAINQEET